MNRCFLVLISILLLVSSCFQQKKEKVIQLDYIENNEVKTLFLIVIEENNGVYKVLRQEYTCDKPSFVIIDIFDYNKL